ncbi:MAG: hydrogenase [Burkholderiales bacterium]|nr:MAG: hydrogenase [Burkholderiales bacterium]
MDTETAATADRRAMHPLLERLVELCGATVLGAADLDAWGSQPGAALLAFTEDPVLYRETLDLAVIVPELAQALPGRFRIGVLLPAAARAAAPRYGFRRWPALVLLKDGRYVGAIDGLREWQAYVEELSRLLAAEPTRPPTIGIAVAADRHAAARGCH